MAAQSHKDLIAWQPADRLRSEVLSLTSRGDAAADLRFRSQARDAASSTCRNLAEGFGRFKPGEFAQFARYSAASNRELSDIIEDGLARNYWKAEEIAVAKNLQIRTAIAVGRLERYLRSKQARENAARIRNSGNPDQ